MTDPRNPDLRNPDPDHPNSGGAAAEGSAVERNTVENNTAEPCTGQTRRTGRDVGMHDALDTVGSLTSGLAYWLSDIATDGSGAGQDASDRSQLLGRMVDQLLTMSSLVEMSLRQRYEERDSTLAWILLEQARQQFGWASKTAGRLEGSSPWSMGFGSGSAGSVPDGGLEDEPASDWADGEDDAPPPVATMLAYLINLDLLPTPEDAGFRIDLGAGADVVPDLRPDTPLELVSLQMMASTAMKYGTVIGQAMPLPLVDRAAYGTYVAVLLEESATLLAEPARASGQVDLQELSRVGAHAAATVRRATPGPLVAFPPKASGADAA